MRSSSSDVSMSNIDGGYPMNNRGGAIVDAEFVVVVVALVVVLSFNGSFDAGTAWPMLMDDRMDEPSSAMPSGRGEENGCSNTDDGLAGNMSSIPCSSSIRKSLNLLTAGISGSDRRPVSNFETCSEETPSSSGGVCIVDFAQLLLWLLFLLLSLLSFTSSGKAKRSQNTVDSEYSCTPNTVARAARSRPPAEDSTGTAGLLLRGSRATSCWRMAMLLTGPLKLSNCFPTGELTTGTVLF